MAEKIIGSWHCPATSVDAEIYVTFTSSNTFALYQKVGDGGFRSYNGTWELTNSDNKYLLSGEYNDGEPWGATYEATSTGDDVITLTAEGVSETYSRVEAIPEDVLSSSVVVVKSQGEESSHGYF